MPVKKAVKKHKKKPLCKALKRGRKTVFTKQLKPVLKMLYLKGCTDKEVCEAVDTDESTLTKWKEKHRKFFTSIVDWKKEADHNIEKSLYERAKGFSHKDTVVLSHQGLHTESVEVEKHYPPDTKAAEIWLRNRKPKDWNASQKIEVDGSKEFLDILTKAAEGEL